MKSANAAIGKTETPIPTPTNEEVAGRRASGPRGGASRAEDTGMMTLRFRAHDFRDGPQRRFPALG